MPVATPVTTPEELAAVAIPVAPDDQEPPVVEEVMVTAAPEHT